MARQSKRLSEEKAQRVLVGLRAGETLRRYSLSGHSPAFQGYCQAHPDYAAEALPLASANTVAARLRKASRRNTTHCRAGLHLMVAENVRPDGGNGKKRCLACRRASWAHVSLLTPDVAEKVKDALRRGASLGQITSGKPTGGGKMNRSLVIARFKVVKRYRQENPDFDRFVAAAIADSNSVGQRIRHQRRLNAAKRQEINDYHSIRAMLPASFPGKDDVVSTIFEDLLTGALKREDVKARVQSYIAAHNRMFPTKFARFGDSPLVSLDEVMFEDGSATRGDSVSRGLWE